MFLIAKKSLVGPVWVLAFLVIAACSATNEELVREQETQVTSEDVTSPSIESPSTAVPTPLSTPSAVPMETPPPLLTPTPTTEIQAGKVSTETLLFPFSEDQPWHNFALSRDGLHLAYTVEDGDKMYVVWDEKQDQTYDHISLFNLQPGRPAPGLYRAGGRAGVCGP